MNIGFYFTGIIFLAAYLAGIVISFACKTGLFAPIRTTILWRGTVNVIIIILASPIYAIGSILAFLGTIFSSPQTYLMLIEYMRLATKSAWQSNPYITARRRFGLMGSIFGGALSGTHSWVSISPFFKLFSAPFASEYGMLFRLNVTFISARNRTISFVEKVSYA